MIYYILRHLITILLKFQKPQYSQYNKFYNITPQNPFLTLPNSYTILSVPDTIC